MSTPGMGARMMHGIIEGDVYDIRTFGDEYAPMMNEVSAELAHLSAYLQTAREADRFYPYELTEDLLLEHDVDVLVNNSPEEYYRLNNKVDGVLTLPTVIDDEFEGRLYKGGIRDFFHGGTE